MITSLFISFMSRVISRCIHDKLPFLVLVLSRYHAMIIPVFIPPLSHDFSHGGYYTMNPPTIHRQRTSGSSRASGGRIFSVLLGSVFTTWRSNKKRLQHNKKIPNWSKMIQHGKFNINMDNGDDNGL